LIANHIADGAPAEDYEAERLCAKLLSPPAGMELIGDPFSVAKGRQFHSPEAPALTVLLPASLGRSLLA